MAGRHGNPVRAPTKSNANRHVPEMRRHKRIGARNDVVRNQRRDPVFEMCTAGAHQLGRVTRPDEGRIRLPGLRIDKPRDRAIVLEAARLTKLDRRLADHQNRDCFCENEQRRGIGSAEPRLCVARDDERRDKCTARRKRRSDVAASGPSSCAVGTLCLKTHAVGSEQRTSSYGTGCGAPYGRG